MPATPASSKASQRLGTLPAPLFLFLAGISFALVTDKLIRKNLTPAEITRTMARRGAEILAFGLLFRLQEFLIAWGWAPWSDLLRVDVLNIIGLSMILMALTCGIILAIWSGFVLRSCPQVVRIRVCLQACPQAVERMAGFSRWSLG
jgi:predicted acyltransferase